MTSSILCQECSTIQASTRYDCFKYSTSNKFCCFNPSKKNCTSIEKTEKKNLYLYDCGISEENYGFYELGEYHPRPKFEIELGLQTCGTENPTKKEDCLEYSELTNSCCFFKNGNSKACFAIGRRYTGELKERSFNFKGENINYECNSFFIIFRLYFIFLLVILFF